MNLKKFLLIVIICIFNITNLYSEEQTKKYANDLAKDYYNKGYHLGVKKIKEELTKLSVAALKDMAKSKGVSGISKMKKADLIKALS